MGAWRRPPAALKRSGPSGAREPAEVAAPMSTKLAGAAIGRSASSISPTCRSAPVPSPSRRSRSCSRTHGRADEQNRLADHLTIMHPCPAKLAQMRSRLSGPRWDGFDRTWHGVGGIETLSTDPARHHGGGRKRCRGVNAETQFGQHPPMLVNAPSLADMAPRLVDASSDSFESSANLAAHDPALVEASQMWVGAHPDGVETNSMTAESAPEPGAPAGHRSELAWDRLGVLSVERCADRIAWIAPLGLHGLRWVLVLPFVARLALALRLR